MLLQCSPFHKMFPMIWSISFMLLPFVNQTDMGNVSLLPRRFLSSSRNLPSPQGGGTLCDESNIPMLAVIFADPRNERVTNSTPYWAE